MRKFAVAMLTLVLGVSFAAAQAHAAPAQPSGPAVATAKAAAGKTAIAGKVSEAKPGLHKSKKTHQKVAMHKKSKKAATRRHARLAAAAKHTAGLTKGQAAFYLPLVRPGMPSRYDIAGWHAPKRSDLLRAVAFEKRHSRSLAQVDGKKGDGRGAEGWYVPASRRGMTGRYGDWRGPAPGGRV